MVWEGAASEVAGEICLVEQRFQRRIDNSLSKMA